MGKKLRFKVSSALKDILGRDLITDDFVAIFELVKNAYDAHASIVKIVFKDIYNSRSSIIIEDNGKGMGYQDLNDKWLFVAYSAKREGTEDDNYIERIGQNRLYAGAKGIGRFSCDRLGKKLKLFSKKSSENVLHSITVDWEEFEESMKDEFGSVDVDYDSKNPDSTVINHGTLLEITELREEWDRKKILLLKDSLAKLINPGRGDQEENRFQIFIEAEEEKLNDIDVYDELKIVNGPVKNFIFEALELKTTQITMQISNNGKFTITELLDGGKLIYRLTEKNSFIRLKGVSYKLFYLNQSAKLTFAKRMGLSTTSYGNIFLYKNGFRIYPFGEPGEDPLKVNARYAQGYNRYLGLRNLIGRIEITGDNPELKETSSRADGLIKTKAYGELENAFGIVLRRLERYVIDVQKWGLGIEEDISQDDEKARNTALFELITKLADAKDIEHIEYGENFIDILNNAQSDSALNFIKKLKTIADETQNENLQKVALSAEKRILQMHSALAEAETEKKTANDATKAVEVKLTQIIKQNFLLKNATNIDTVEILSIEHHINQATHRVDRHLKRLVEGIQSQENVDYLIDISNKISLENRKISSLVNFVRKATFDTMSSSFTGDLINYIAEYIENIYKEDAIRIVNKTLIDVDIYFNPNDNFIVKFVPLEINIILDNLLDNSFKASATKAEVNINKVSESALEITYSDNGIGIENEIIDKIFDFGFTTTKNGSGIGLFHVKKILSDSYNGSIIAVKDLKHGAEFKLTIKIN